MAIIAIWIKFERILNQCCQAVNSFSHICFATYDVNVFNTSKIVLHQFFSSLMTVWMMCSSTPLKKEISTLPVLIVQVGLEDITTEFLGEVFSFSVCNVTGTMVSFCCGM